MNPITKTFRAVLASINKAWMVGRMSFALYNGGVKNLYEAGRRFQYGDRSAIWSFVGDSRFDATQATRIELLRKIRYFEQNSPLVQKLADLFEIYAVGPNGLVISPNSEDEEWVTNSKQWYSDWGQQPDLSSLLPLASLQSLSARLWFVDGEVFLLKTRTNTAPYRPRIQLIESHRVGTPSQMAGQEGRTIIDGVEVDLKGKPIAYWVQDGFDAADYTRVPAENMIHIHEPSRVGMYRGLTMFYAVLNVLHDLDDLMRMEMIVAKDQADTSKVIKTPTGEAIDPEDPNGWNPQVESLDGQANPLTEFYRRTFGPTTKMMKIGDEIDKSGPERPTVVQQWYWKFLHEEVCNGVGIPLVMVYPESMQGTVYRGVLDSANAYFRSRSALLSNAWKQVWEYVIGFGSQVDVLIADKPVDWKLVTVRPPRAVNVDVGRNSSAMLAELEAGTRNFADIYAETGEDWREKLEQKAKEAAYIKKLATKYSVEPTEITSLAVVPPPLVAPPIPLKKSGGPQQRAELIEA
ncbi:MAG: phage portal protein lambda family [Pedosphaera sp.]|nr:phage portal protein lambda family [Pedosphaera sp.]